VKSETSEKKLFVYCT